MLQYRQPEPYGDVSPSIPADSLWQHSADALHHSIWRVAQLLVSLLPGVVTLLLALVLFTAAGLALSFALRRILAAAHFDERLKRSQGAEFADWCPNHSPTALVGRVAFWSAVLLGLAVGISALDAAYATGSALTLSLMPYLTHTVGATLLLLAGNLLARFLARTVLIAAVQRDFNYARALSSAVKWMVLVLAAAMALEHLRIGGAILELAFGILFGGLVLTVSLAVGLGARDLVAHTLATLPLHLPGTTPLVAPEPPKHVVVRHF